MYSLEDNLKELIKESIREVLREAEFSQRAIPVESTQTKAVTESPRKLAVKISEAAEMLSLNTVTVRRLISRGVLKVSRSTRHPLISISELERFLKV